jgi:hypothetical protein
MRESGRGGGSSAKLSAADRTLRGREDRGSAQCDPGVSWLRIASPSAATRRNALVSAVPKAQGARATSAPQQSRQKHIDERSYDNFTFDPTHAPAGRLSTPANPSGGAGPDLTTACRAHRGWHNAFLHTPTCRPELACMGCFAEGRYRRGRRCLAAAEVLEDHVERLALLAVVRHRHRRRADHLLDVARLVVLHETNPLTQLLLFRDLWCWRQASQSGLVARPRGGSNRIAWITQADSSPPRRSTSQKAEAAVHTTGTTGE